MILESVYERCPGFLEDMCNSQFLKKTKSCVRDGLNSGKHATGSRQHERPEAEIAKADRNSGSSDTRTSDHHIARTHV